MQIPSYAVRPPSGPAGPSPPTDPAQPSLEAVVATVTALSGKRPFASPDDAPAEQDKVFWSQPVRQALGQHRADRPHGREDDPRARRRSGSRGDPGGGRGSDRGARTSTESFAGLLRRVMAWVTGRPV